jgi:3-ketosteroid 9alpha-monooxygenase subunit B
MGEKSESMWHSLRVVEVIDETSDARSYVFEVPPESEAQFVYRAGQFLTFRIPWEDFAIERSYSLASAPSHDVFPKVTVKRVQDGRASNWFHDNVAVGQTLDAQTPAGRFVLRAASHQRPLVLWAAGSGITPIYSLLREVLGGTMRRAKLIYANRTKESIIFHREIADLLLEYPGRFQLVHRLDSISGDLNADFVLHETGGWSEAEFYLCGPSLWMDVVGAALDQAGIASESILQEKFVSPRDPDRNLEAEEPSSAAGNETATTPTEIEARVQGSWHRVPHVPGQTILASLHAAGIEAEFQCEEGYCACCMAKMVEGQASMKVNDALSEKEVAEGWVLTCQARPRGPICRVDYDSF